MNHTKNIFILILVSLLFLLSCGKKDTEKSTQDEKIKNFSIDSIEWHKYVNFYECNDLKYWQNFPGVCPVNRLVDLALVKDSLKKLEIIKSIKGLTNDTVYTCEYDRIYFTNYFQQCPKCGLNMVKLKDLSRIVSQKRMREMDKKWKDKKNIELLSFKVPKAGCENCEQLILVSLKRDEGVLDAMVDLDNRMTYLYFNNKKTSKDSVENLLLKSGFDVENLKGDTNAIKYLPDCCK